MVELTLGVPLMKQGLHQHPCFIYIRIHYAVFPIKTPSSESIAIIKSKPMS